MSDRSIRVTAGLLVRKQLRFELDAVKLKGWPIEWVENKRFLESDFVIRGPAPELKAIVRSMEKFNANN